MTTMQAQRKIAHDGIIEQIEGDMAHVKIRNGSACAACHAKAGCGAADQKEKYLDVPLQGRSFKPGERVLVEVTRRLAFRAVTLGYILPFLLVLGILIGLLAAGVDELTAGWLALVSLPPYYLLLFLFKNRMETAFSFSIRRREELQ